MNWRLGVWGPKGAQRFDASSTGGPGIAFTLGAQGTTIRRVIRVIETIRRTLKGKASKTGLDEEPF